MTAQLTGFPLSTEQRSMLYMRRLLGAEIFHNISLVHPLPASFGPADFERLRARLLARQGALRVSGYDEKAGTQWALDGPPPPRDGTVRVDGADGLERRLAELHQARICPDLSDSLAHVEMVEQDNGDKVLVGLLDHTVADGGSRDVLADDVAAVLAGEPDGRATPALTFGEHCVASAGRGNARTERELNFWSTALAGVEALPGTRPDEGEPARCEQYDVTRYDASLYERLRAVEAELGVTAFAFVMAVCAAVLASRTGLERFALFTPVSTRAAAGAEHLVGNFVVERPIPCDVAPGVSLAELAKRIAAALLGATRYTNLGIGELVERIPALATVLEGDDVHYFQLHVSMSSRTRQPADPAAHGSVVRSGPVGQGLFRPNGRLTCTTFRVAAYPGYTFSRVFLGGGRKAREDGVATADTIWRIITDTGFDLHAPLPDLTAYVAAGDPFFSTRGTGRGG